MAAPFHGKGGTASFGATTITFITDWSIDMTIDVAESTSMNQGDDYKTYLGGFPDWTATVTSRLDDAGFDCTINQAASLIITAKSGDTFTGNAICTGINPSADKDDVAALTYTFQGNGALTPSP